MTEALLELVPRYGLWLMLATTFLSCLALPIPASVVMLTAGGFAASGDLVLWQVALFAFAGAVLGDQAGYHIGRRGGAGLLDRLRVKPSYGVAIGKAEALIVQRGRLGVFLSRWLFSPLGPWLNFAAGALALPLVAFTLCCLAGDLIWVGGYVGLGYAFAGNILQLGEILGNASGLLAGLLVLSGLGLWLRAALIAKPVASAESEAALEAERQGSAG